MPDTHEIESSMSELMAFLDASPTAWHAVARMREALEGAGFEGLDEGQAWKLEAGGRYFVVRNGSALVALVVGSLPAPEAGLMIVGAHTDSPALKLKPDPSSTSGGYVTLGVEVYGGPILATWTDRDLKIAGRVAIRSTDAPGGVEMRLVDVREPLVTVPNLAIHLNRKVNDDGLKVNAQDNLPALFALDAGDGSGDSVLDLVAGQVNAGTDDLLGFDLLLCDVQPSALAGRDRSLLRSGRMDDLAMCHAGLAALLRAAGDDAPFTRVLVCYDNEEVGSATAQGAASPFLADVIERVVLAHSDGREDLMRAVSRSWLLSADMAHALNPNYASKHDAKHRPVLGGGPVLKVNASMRYATDAGGWALFERLCRDADVPCQRYVNRSDLPCGSTIGPIASSRLGIRTVDVGNPILAMHSIRETCGVGDHEHMVRALATFYARGG